MPGPGPGGRPPRGVKPNVKIKNPGKIIKRTFKLVGKNYWLHCIVVLICIILTVYASVQGTMFTKTLLVQTMKDKL